MDDVKQLRLSLWENGYRPVAVRTQSKRPFGDNWLELAMCDPPYAVTDRVHPAAISTGIVCQWLRAIDIDIDDKEMADEIERISFEVFGETITRFKKKSPRRLFLYRTCGVNTQKRILEFQCGYKIEVLGPRQKFVGFGIHEEGMIYEWRDNISPLDVPADQLAEISEHQIDTFFEICESLYPIKKKEIKAQPVIQELFVPITEGRARIYALFALEAVSNDLSCMAKGGRNNALNSASMRLGGMHARGWLTGSECQEALRCACEQNGLIKEDGITSFMKTFLSGWSAGITNPAKDPVDRDQVREQAPVVRENQTTGDIPPSQGIKAQKPPPQPLKIIVTPYEWRNSLSILKRQWIYGHHLTRKFISLTIAPGAVGKTSLLVADALSLVSGKDFLGTKVYGGPKRVWLWNLEDPRDEIERRIVATMERYDITQGDIGDRLYLDSGRDNPLCMARQERNGVIILKPVIEALVTTLKENKIDVLIIDPFVSSHSVSENDNGAIDAVAKAWGYVAEQADCAIELVHHLRKTGDNEATAESARGAVSLIAAARSVRVLNRMTKTEAAKAGLDTNRGYFRAYDDKNNLAPALTESHWFQLESVHLANGDDVGVVTPWRWPNANQDVSSEDLLEIQRSIDGKHYREDSQSNDWVGNSIAEVLDLDVSDESNKTRIKYLIKFWINSGALIVEVIKDKKSMNRKCISVGEWASSTPR